ncbi:MULTISPECIES: metalloregulator ArsR/SmtB family transcription factor [unclassified Pseudactinotalea]|uniref:helix-turn-helix transcriptional regulator n=1 Tax=unclassified Pseudactinotalea TaxID=2649176 RepID=UPI00128B3E71|nr:MULTISPECIES: HTH domain-containing protein [unclassified Pseudactinotalea]MPV49830.1 HTH domain-containing protein [Pseudactinotalea sp. HY160]QGH69096.1 HTH domain-containing protein [Pseudactinotalea sp. HY158]
MTAEPTAPAGGDVELVDTDAGTRDRVLRLIVERGPITAADLAELLDLTSAAIRRHLSGLEAAREVRVQDEVAGAKRGRGRPAKRYVAAPDAKVGGLGTEYAESALAALEQLNDALGPEAITTFARGRADRMGERYAAAIEAAGDDLTAKARALADALSEDGYAATVRPIGDGIAVQVCQGHCPVLRIATAHPELCEEETRMFSELLGVHVQRLATLAGGEHVCTTHIPVMFPTHKDTKDDA